MSTPSGPRAPAVGLFDPMTPEEMLRKLELKAGESTEPIDLEDEVAVLEEYDSLLADMESIDAVMDHMEAKNSNLEARIRGLLADITSDGAAASPAAACEGQLDAAAAAASDTPGDDSASPLQPSQTPGSGTGAGGSE